MKAILFDLYDTLVGADWDQLSAPLAARLGVDRDRFDQILDETRPARNLGQLAFGTDFWSEVVSEFGQEPTPELIEDLMSLRRRFFTEHVRLYPDVPGVLRDLRGAGVKTALVSNCSNETRPLVERLGLPDEMDTVVLSFEVGARKPDAAIYQEALVRIGVGPEEALFVDDQPQYCDGAAALGIETRLMKRDLPHPLHEVSAHGANHQVIKDLTQLLAGGAAV